MENKKLPNDFLIVVAGLAFSTLALGQQVPGAGTLLQGVGGKPDQAPVSAPAIDVQKEPPKRMQAPAGLKIKAEGFRISGATVYTEAELLVLLDQFKGRELDFDQLQDAADAVASHYKKNGYFLAYAYLPAQEIKGGVVTFAVLEGRVGKVRIELAKDAKISEQAANTIISGNIKPGDLITERGLETGLLLLNDLPGVDVKSTLTPGAQVGTADLVVSVGAGSRFSGQLEYDNFGHSTTGQHRFGGSASINSPLGLGDQLTVRGLDTDTGDMKYLRLGYSLPVGHLGTRLGVAQTQMSYKLGDRFLDLKAHGKADISNYYVLHPVYRTRNLNVFAQLGYDDKNLKDYTDSTLSRNFKASHNGVVAIFGDSRDGIFGGGMNTYSLSYTLGHLSLDTPGVKAIDQSAGGLKVNGGFNKGNLQLSRLQSIAPGMAFFAAYSQQTASKNLDTSEKFSLGGSSGVRAYPQGEASVDEGYLFTGELRFGLDKLGTQLPGSFGLAAFFDSARGKINKIPLATDTSNTKGLAGGGLSLTWGEPGDFMLRLSSAWRVGSKALADNDRDPRITLSGIKWF